MDWKKNCRKRRFFFPLDRAVTYVRIGTCFQRLGAPKLTGSRSFRAVIAKQFAHQYFVMSVVVNTEQGQWNAVGQNGNVGDDEHRVILAPRRRVHELRSGGAARSCHLWERADCTDAGTPQEPVV